MSVRFILFAASINLLLFITWSSADEQISFTRQIRPIPSAKCFACHGPDEKTREADLRLDSEDAVRNHDGSTVIAPGNPDASDLYIRITSDDADERMPPADSNKSLSETEIDLLWRWIKEGGRFESHWAFVPPRAAELPAVKNPAWPRNAIDYFVLAKLEQAGLSPSEEADRYTLVRRLYLDLVGFPPSSAEADAFVYDDDPAACENLVDKLLASPHYGERWARRWLDLARYADTNGYEKDRPRSIWPYRDWIINSINADMPFDQFTVEQIAGDMLPNATIDQKIATGFHRNTMLNEEGGIDPLEFRFHAMTDRVATTGQVWLGLTIGCAQCHTHKFDPITQREYYEFMAFLDNADEPDLALPDPIDQQRRRNSLTQIEQLEAKLADQFPPDAPNGPSDQRSVATRRAEHLNRKFSQWQKEARRGIVPWQSLKPLVATSNLPLLTIQDDDTIFASGDQTKSDTYEVRLQNGLKTITAIRLDVLPDERLPAAGPGRTFYEGRKGDFFLSEFTVLVDGKPVEFESATESYGKLAIGRGASSAALAIDGDQHTGWSTSGREGQPNHAVFRLKQPLDGPGEVVVKMLFERHYAAGLGKFRISATSSTESAAAKDLPPSLEPLLLKSPAELTRHERDQLLRQYLRVAPELSNARKPIDALRKQIPVAPFTMVMRERPTENPRPTHIHHRGEFMQTRDLVMASTPAALHPLPADTAHDRLAFSRWLVARNNPLVARVTANRQWAAIFGTGIVSTQEDFGFQGDPPSHPELLDWLASELMQQGWSLKWLHRQIVTSATYRQSSRVTPELLRADPNNRLLARGPRVRMDAEQIRDSVLQASGLLTAKLGGPSVYPPQPASITTEGAYGKLAWKVSLGEDRFRRGLYTFTKRTTPYAMFSTFDGPSGESCVVRREVSNTPLQALTMLNDEVILEAARALGTLAANQPGNDNERSVQLFRRCFTRSPSEQELAMLVEFYRLQRDRFAKDKVRAEKLAGPSKVNLVDRAAWTALARALLNIDEMIVKD
jgi:hypothetical protein